MIPQIIIGNHESFVDVPNEALSLPAHKFDIDIPSPISNRTISIEITVLRCFVMGKSSEEVITWYAFHCPKFKREYFYEPSSGETSWAKPTYKSITSAKEKKSSAAVSYHQSTKPNHASNITEEKNMRIKTNQPSKVGLFIVTTLIASLICNTIFLIVLVKISALHPTPSAVNATVAVESCQRAELKNSSTELDTANQVNDVLIDVIAEEKTEPPYVEAPVEEIVDDEAAEEKESSAINTDISEDSLVNDKEIKSAQGVVNDVPTEPVAIEESEKEEPRIAMPQTTSGSEADHKQQKITHSNERYGKKSNGITEASTQQSADEKVAKASTQQSAKGRAKSKKKKRDKRRRKRPIQCWIPFANVFNRRCRINKNATVDTDQMSSTQ